MHLTQVSFVGRLMTVAAQLPDAGWNEIKALAPNSDRYALWATWQPMVASSKDGCAPFPAVDENGVLNRGHIGDGCRWSQPSNVYSRSGRHVSGNLGLFYCWYFPNDNQLGEHGNWRCIAIWFHNAPDSTNPRDLKPYACATIVRTEGVKYGATIRADCYRGDHFMRWEHLDWARCDNNHVVPGVTGILVDSYPDQVMLGNKGHRKLFSQNLLVFDYLRAKVKDALNSHYWGQEAGQLMPINDRYFTGSLYDAYISPEAAAVLP